MKDALLQLSGLRLRLGTQELLTGVDLQIAAAQVVALVGESGSGKTLTALSAIRLEPEGALLGGSIRWCGQELLGLDEAALTRAWHRHVVPGCGRQPASDPVDRCTAAPLVALAWWRQSGAGTPASA